MKYIKLLLAASTLFFASLSNAAIITYGSYTHDDSTDIVNGDGLEWLQWDRTDGMSIQDATALLDTIEGGGWSIASNVQMASLFNNFELGGSTSWDSREDDSQFASVPIDATEDNSANIFISMFGTTATPSNMEGSLLSGAYFGSDLDGDGFYKVAEVFDDYTSGGIDYPGLAKILADGYSTNVTSNLLGVALVRSASVPEPSIVALFGLGLVGIGFMRRRRS